ncbi:Rv3235 family protein [Micromonospora sp. NPDC007230]|uniref:Rv3235 family protein n=1 Tax=Micromonospora sp. NPDC007230 TaxID=3364237 RepID=UPI0036A01D79
MVDTRRPLAPRPPVRLRPAPPIDPPCTDEGLPWADVDQLTLDLFDPRRRDPDRPDGRAPDVRPVPTGPGRRTGGAPAAALATATPEATRAAHRFVRTFLEIVNGYRPPGQLRPLCLPDATTRVATELTRAARRVGPIRRRATRPALQLRRLRVCEPRAGAAEAAAVLAGAGGASWAIALRVEHRRGTWLCTTLEVL